MLRKSLRANLSLYQKSSITFCFQNNSKIPGSLKASDFLLKRHVDLDEQNTKSMLDTCKVTDFDHLMSKVIPSSVQDKEAFHFKGSQVPPAVSERESLIRLEKIGNMNKLYKTYIGTGYANTIIPPVIQRNLFENPGWYTSYTPYQSEISQGRLEGLFTFQTMVSEITGLDVAVASLLDESTACAETLYIAMNKKKPIFFVDQNTFPQNIGVFKTKAKYLGVEVVVGDIHTQNIDEINEKYSGVLVQNPGNNGQVYDYTELFSKITSQDCVKVIASDLAANTLFKTPGQMGADICVGNSQRFGVPLGYGGPHAGFMSAKEKFLRKLPGRIIGLSKDAHDNPAYRIAIQTREQHIKRDRATSNICTAQALLANIAGMYGVFHGPHGVKEIQIRIHSLTKILANYVNNAGFDVTGFKQGEEVTFFDTIQINTSKAKELVEFFVQQEINLRLTNDNQVGVSLDETIQLKDVFQLVQLFQKFQNKTVVTEEEFANECSKPLQNIKQSLVRTTPFMTQDIFNSHHTETQMMRYLYKLQLKDISLVHSMISLGSCTMKLNAASQLQPVSWGNFGNLHPFVPVNQALGYRKVMDEAKDIFLQITKLDGISFQPNAGASGEYAGLLCIRQYHESRGEGHRKVILIPDSAHGTNFATAAVAGMKVVKVEVDGGSISLKDLKLKAEKHKKDLAATMITYPGTTGKFEDTILECTKIIHENGGQVYMDGANMNAQCGFTSPGYIGADVCHLNLHKTFAIPHGGGGPGLGTICVKEHLIPFLPNHPIIDTGSQTADVIAAAPFSSASILLISYQYLVNLGYDGIKRSTGQAVLNANYLRRTLMKHYKVFFDDPELYVAHEFIIDCKPFKKCGIKEKDIAKRLIDYNFHAPTMSFPVAGTLMVEPTESEDKGELDRFIDAMIQIRAEIKQIEDGVYPLSDNPLVNSPHTQEHCTATEWTHPYTREEACYPVSYIKERGKYWSPVGRNDDSWGDLNFCGTMKD